MRKSFCVPQGSLYAFGGSCTGLGHVPALQKCSEQEYRHRRMRPVAVGGANKFRSFYAHAASVRHNGGRGVYLCMSAAAPADML